LLDIAGYGYLGILVLAFTLNLLPFASPSNLIIAVDAALLTQLEPFLIGILIAAAASSAKLIHYYFMFFMRRALKEERRAKLERYGSRIERWGSVAIFVAATTPVPDDPLIIPLGLMRYSPVKLCLSYFSGKLLIATAGAYLGGMGGFFVGSLLGMDALIAISVVLTVGVTVALIKVDVDKVLAKLHQLVKRA